MRAIKYMAITLFVMLVGCIISCSPHLHNINILNESSIYPENEYLYSTSEDIYFSVNEKIFIIENGFKTDLASIPRVYWSILSPRYTNFVTPSIIHDYLYQCAPEESRLFADEVLYGALLQKGVSRYTATKFYLAVRLFGSKYYNPKICKDNM